MFQRFHRLRRTPTLREMVREVRLHPSDFILPLFASEKIASAQPVASMPGVSQMTPTEIVSTCRTLAEKGLHSVILFGIPSEKDAQASQAYAEEGIVQRTVRLLKKEIPQLVVITDVCLCEYMEHGHCGILTSRDPSQPAAIDNDATLELLAQTALSHARAGADIIAPSDMMDGRIRALRTALDSEGFLETPLMSYAAKMASAFYGPFRDAGESAPQFGDRRSYQMDGANAREALREAEADLEEGADILMVKPGLAYLDILRQVKERFECPTAVYNVSGEYSMIKAAAQNGWLEEKPIVLEIMQSFKRAGADLILTYWAADLLDWLAE